MIQTTKTEVSPYTFSPFSFTTITDAILNQRKAREDILNSNKITEELEET